MGRMSSVERAYLNLLVAIGRGIDAENHAYATFAIEVALEERGQLRLSVRDHLEKWMIAVEGSNG